MKTWEMIKELTENQNKRFKNQYGDVVGKGNGQTDKKGFTDGVFYKNNTPCRYEVDLNDVWEEVKEPVDFMTAFNAWWSDNKTISYELDGHKYTINTKSDVKFYPREIKYAKWFIED